MTHYDPASEETEDRFHVQYDSRDVKLMTLDELQAAFEAGEIHENTFVCREGDSEWLTLSVVAGLGDEEEQPEPVAAERRPPMPARRPEGVETRPPMPTRRPDVVETRPPMPERRPAMPAPRQASTYPSSAPTQPARSIPLSFAPVTSNINTLDLDELSLRPKRRVGRVFAVATVLALVGGGAAFARNGGLRLFVMPSLASLEAAAGKSQASLTLSNIQAPPSTPVAAAAPVPPAPAPVPEAVVTPPAPSGAAATPQFNDDMKQALLAADKDRTTKHEQKRKARSAPASASVSHRSRGAGSGTGFKSSGSAYDPLNGKL